MYRIVDELLKQDFVTTTKSEYAISVVLIKSQIVAIEFVSITAA